MLSIWIFAALTFDSGQIIQHARRDQRHDHGNDCNDDKHFNQSEASLAITVKSAAHGDAADRDMNARKLTMSLTLRCHDLTYREQRGHNGDDQATHDDADPDNGSRACDPNYSDPSCAVALPRRTPRCGCSRSQAVPSPPLSLTCALL